MAFTVNTTDEIVTEVALLPRDSGIILIVVSNQAMGDNVFHALRSKLEFDKVTPHCLEVVEGTTVWIAGANKPMRGREVDRILWHESLLPLTQMLPMIFHKHNEIQAKA